MRPRSRSCRMDCRGNGRDGRAPLPWLLSLAVLRPVGGGRLRGRGASMCKAGPQTRAAAQTGINVDIDVEDRSTTQARPQPPTAPDNSPGPSSASGRPRSATPPPSCKREAPRSPRQRSSTKDPITIVGNAYVSIIGRYVRCTTSSTPWTSTKPPMTATPRITTSS